MRVSDFNQCDDKLFHMRRLISPIPQNLSTILDLVRFSSCLAVVMGHLFSLMYISKPLTFSDNYFIFRLVNSWAHEGVIIFFILSGYLVGRKTFQYLDENRSAFWQSYLIDRISRLSIVAIPGFFLGVTIDMVGWTLFTDNPIYQAASYNSQIYHTPVDATFTLIQFLGTLSFLQRISGPEPFGSNIPLWSLAYEFWFYIAFPVCIFGALALLRRQRIQYPIFGLLFIWIFVVASNLETLNFFIIWCMGAFASLIKPNFLSRPFISKISLTSFLLLFFAALIVSSTDLVAKNLSDWLIAVPAAVILVISQTSKFVESSFLLKHHKTLATLSNFSFSTYVVHYPFLVFLYAAAVSTRYQKTSPDILNMSVYLIIVIIVLLYGWLFSQVTEKHTLRFRSWLKKSLLKHHKK